MASPQSKTATRISKAPAQIPQARIEKVDKKEQGKWERAVCLIEIGGRRQCTGILVMSNGIAVILCSCMEMRSAEVAAQARALFYCSYQAQITATARLLPYEKFEQLEYDMALIAVDIKSLMQNQVLPIMPSPETLASLTKSMSYIGTGPALNCAVYLGTNVPKTILTLHLDDYLESRDILHFKQAINSEAHGAPIFYKRQFIGVAIADAFHTDLNRGIGTKRLLAPFRVSGVDFQQYSNTKQIAPWTGAGRFFIPNIQSPTFSSHVQMKPPLHLSTADDNIAKLALQAVHEANLSLLRRVHQSCCNENQNNNISFLRDLRFGGNWCLAFIAATAEKSAPMLISLADEFHLDLSRKSHPFQDTLAHIAAYHSNIPALRILKARRLELDSPNAQTERPADKIRNDQVRAWFERHHIIVPTQPSFHSRYDDDNTLGITPRMIENDDDCVS